MMIQMVHCMKLINVPTFSKFLGIKKGFGDQVVIKLFRTSFLDTVFIFYISEGFPGKHKRAELKYFSSTCYESTTGRKSDTLQFDNSVLIQKGLTLPKNGRDTKYFLLFSS